MLWCENKSKRQFMFRYSCDQQIVTLMRVRTLGNSSTHVSKRVTEQHGETHAAKALQFMQAGEPFHLKAARGLLQLPSPPPIPPMQPCRDPPGFWQCTYGMW